MPARRYLLLNRRNDPELRYKTERIREALLRVAGGDASAFELVTAKDDYEKNAARLGGWDEWVHGWVLALDLSLNDFRYTGFVLPERSVGKVTADIVSRALTSHRRVAWLNDDGEFEFAYRVDQVSKSFTDGWEILTKKETK